MNSPVQLSGDTRLVLEYTRDQVNFPYFQVWYKCQVTGQEVLDSWQNKRMTGFKMTWRIDNPALELSTSEVGRTVKTPGLGLQYDRQFYLVNHSYKAVLLFPGDLAEQVDDGVLEIEVEVDTRDQEGWEESVKTSKGGPRQFKLYHRQKEMGGE